MAGAEGPIGFRAAGFPRGRARRGGSLMSEILLHYKRPDPTTWVYLSSFLTIGLFFVFHRFWSMRNLDLVLLILLAPGLLIVHEGRRRQLIEWEEATVRAALLEQLEPVVAATGQLPVGGTAEASRLPVAGVDQAAGGGTPGGATGAEQAPGQTTADGPTTNAATGQGPPADELPEDEEGLTMSARDLERYGFIWLLSVQVLILIRLLLDPLMIRRPLLDPNLTAGGLMFLSVWLFIFMTANVITSTPRLQVEHGPQLGPGYALMNMLPAIPTRPVYDMLADTRMIDGSVAAAPTEAAKSPRRLYVMLARVLAIAAHLAIVVGIAAIGYRHFGNPRAGIGCATLYLLMPYTAQMTGRVDHALPAALLIWALLSYRRPLFAGLFLGAAAGLVYYPLFLLPLWISFYWLAGVRRFIGGVSISLLVMMALLVVDGTEPLSRHLLRMYGLMMPLMHDLRGVWGLGWEPIYRLPILVAFLLLSGFFAAWPAQKNFGTLIAYSAALMVASQFWHAYGGGLYLAWFLPLLLLTIFRPNLEDRVASKVVDAGRPASARRAKIAHDLV